MTGSTHNWNGIAPYGIRFNLGTIYPGQPERIINTIVSPTAGQVGPGMNFEISFHYDYYGISETPGDRWTITVGAGGVMMFEREVS